jgi:putative ABC transport system ATP-binding protein
VSEPALFDFVGVDVEQGGTRVLRDIDVTIPEAGITVLVGRSGAGKSTLLRCCNRLEVPTTGVVRFRGRSLADVDVLAHRRTVGMVFQQPTAFPGTVLDNVRAADPGVDEARGGELLRHVGLDPAMLGQVADTLSGGEMQRMVLARALATRPSVLLADEPTAALDTESSAQLESLVLRLAKEGMPILWVTHDLGQMRRLADHLVALDSGHIVYTGAPGDYSDRPMAGESET